MKKFIVIFMICGFALALFSMTSCNRKSPEEALGEAQAKMQNRDFIGARIDLKEFLQKNPDHEMAVQARFMLGQCYFAVKDFTQAREHFRKIYDEQGPASPLGQRSIQFLLSSYRAEKKFKDAIDFAETALKDIPEEEQMNFMLKGMICDLVREDGRTTEAVTCYKNLIKDAATEEQTLQALERLISFYASNQQFEEAVKAYQNFMENNPDYKDKGNLYAGQAFFYSKLGEEEKAEELYNKTLAHYDEMIKETLDKNKKAEFIFRQGRALELQKKYGEAREKYKIILDEYSDTELGKYAHLALGDSYFLQGEPRKTIDYFKELLQKENLDQQFVRQVRNRLSRLMQQQAYMEQQDGATTGTLKRNVRNKLMNTQEKTRIIEE